MFIDMKVSFVSFHLQVQYTALTVLQACGADGLETKLGKIVPSSQCVVRRAVLI